MYTTCNHQLQMHYFAILFCWLLKNFQSSTVPCKHSIESFGPERKVALQFNDKKNNKTTGSLSLQVIKHSARIILPTLTTSFLASWNLFKTIPAFIGSNKQPNCINQLHKKKWHIFTTKESTSRRNLDIESLYYWPHFFFSRVTKSSVTASTWISWKYAEHKGASKQPIHKTSNTAVY